MGTGSDGVHVVPDENSLRHVARAVAQAEPLRSVVAATVPAPQANTAVTTATAAAPAPMIGFRRGGGMAKSGGAASERGKAQEGKGDRTRARALAAWWLERESPQWRTSSGAFFIRPRTSAASCWPHFRSHALVAILRQVWPPSCAWHPPYSLVPSAVSGVGNLVSQAGYRPRRRGLPPRRTQMSVHPCMFRRNAGRGPPQVGPAGRPGGSSDSVPPGVWEVVASD